MFQFEERLSECSGHELRVDGSLRHRQRVHWAVGKSNARVPPLDGILCCFSLSHLQLADSPGRAQVRESKSESTRTSRTTTILLAAAIVGGILLGSRFLSVVHDQYVVDYINTPERLRSLFLHFDLCPCPIGGFMSIETFASPSKNCQPPRCLRQVSTAENSAA